MFDDIKSESYDNDLHNSGCLSNLPKLDSRKPIMAPMKLSLSMFGVHYDILSTFDLRRQQRLHKACRDSRGRAVLCTEGSSAGRFQAPITERTSTIQAPISQGGSIPGLRATSTAWLHATDWPTALASRSRGESSTQPKPASPTPRSTPRCGQRRTRAGSAGGPSSS